MQALRIVQDNESTSTSSAPVGQADAALRPTSLAEYAGQHEATRVLATAISAARAGQWTLDHVLISGPGGLGKTTLAKIIANEMGGKLVLASAPSISHRAELAGLLTQLATGDVLFIDELHRLAVPLQEMLYTAIEDFRVDLFAGKGKSGTAVSIPLPKFTLVGATTHAGMLTSSFRERFGIQCQLQFYGVDDLAAIVARSAGLLNMWLPADAYREIARRSRGTPRIANRLVRRVRDAVTAKAYECALVRPNSGSQHVVLAADLNDVVAALDAQGIDSLGLDATDRAYLELLTAAPGAVGIEALAAAVSAPRATLEEVVEPFLLQLGFVARTGRGRIATEAGRQHLAGGQ